MNIMRNNILESNTFLLLEDLLLPYIPYTEQLKLLRKEGTNKETFTSVSLFLHLFVFLHNKIYSHCNPKLYSTRKWGNGRDIMQYCLINETCLLIQDIFTCSMEKNKKYQQQTKRKALTMEMMKENVVE